MFIKIKNGTFGYRERLADGSYSISVHAKTSQDSPFEVEDEIGIRLITDGIAEAVNPIPIPTVATALPDEEDDAPGNDMPDTENAAEGNEAAHLDSDQLDKLSFQDLKDLAIDMGIDIKALRSKTALIEAIAAVEVEAPDDGEQPPALDAESMLV